MICVVSALPARALCSSDETQLQRSPAMTRPFVSAAMTSGSIEQMDRSISKYRWTIFSRAVHHISNDLVGDTSPFLLLIAVTEPVGRKSMSRGLAS